MIKYFQHSPTGSISEIFTAVSDKVDSRMHWNENELAYPKAYISIRKPVSHPNFYPAHGGLNPAPFFEGEPPTTLFTDSPAEIEEAYSHTSMRHTVPTLLGLAKNRYHVLQAPENLSPYSSRLVKRGEKMGAVVVNPDNPTAEVMHLGSFSDADNLAYTSQLENPSSRIGPTKRVPDTDIQNARNTIREILRPRKEHRNVMTGPQFDHPRLPGVDW